MVIDQNSSIVKGDESNFTSERNKNVKEEGTQYQLNGTKKMLSKKNSIGSKSEITPEKTVGTPALTVKGDKSDDAVSDKKDDNET